MKKISVFLCLTFVSALFAGCRKAMPSVSGKTGSEKINIVCTTFPVYDWTKNITGGSQKISVSLIERNGVDLHNFQPSAADLVLIQNADLFIFIGGESDDWINDTVLNNVKKSLCLFNLDFNKLGEDGEVLTEDEHIHCGISESDEEHHDGHHGEGDFDEHVWLSLRNAVVFCNGIASAVCSLDMPDSQRYLANSEEYKSRLENLDKKFVRLFSENKPPVIIMCDRFPFKYFAYDYSLEYYAAFNGCSAESEASFGKIAFLADKIDSLDAGFVFTLENSDNKLAQTVIRSSSSGSCGIYALDSMQSVGQKELDNGASYISCFEKNYSVLKSALESAAEDN